jgi:P4 family phage/plasmid primase-like protien
VTETEAARYLAAEKKKKSPRFATEADAAEFLPRDRRARWEAWALKCEFLTRIKPAMEAARDRLLVDIEDLDADPWSLTVPNGRVDLRAVVETDFSGMDPDEEALARCDWLKPQDWTARPTKCAGVEFDPEAQCPRFLDFLELIQPDPEMREFMHRCFGILVYGRNDAQAFLLLRGGGCNGKSTMTDLLQFVLGERDGYAAACKVDMFLVGRDNAAAAASPEEVDLPGARAYFASEPAATDTFSAKKIKALTGGDRRPVRALNKDQFYYYPRGVPVISFNRTPRIKDEDEGTRRRLVFIPFDVELHKLPPEKRRAPAEVQAELRAEGPGVLNWLLE